MRYPDLVALIKTTAETVNPTGFFWHGRISEASINHEQPFPQVHSYTGTHSKTGGALRYNVLLAFYGQDVADSNADESLAIHGQMQVLADQFLKAFKDNASIQVSDSITVEPLTKDRLIMGSGWALRFSVEAIEVCL